MSVLDDGDARVLWIAMLGTISGVLPAFMVGAVAVQARGDLHFDTAAQGFLVAIPFMVAAVTSALFGRVAERLGGARTLRFTSAAAAVVMVGLALAPTFASLAFGLALAGALNAMAQPAANHLVARSVHVRNQGLAFGLKQSAMPAATMLAGLAVPTVALTVGWRWAFVAGALVALTAALLVPRRLAGGPPLRTLRGGERSRPDAPLPPLFVLAVGAAFGAAAAGALAGFLVTAGVDAGLGEGAAGWLLTVGSALGMTSRVIFGARADRRPGGNLPVVATMMIAGSVAFGIFATGTPTALVLATPLAFGFGWAWPGLFNFAVVRNNPSAPAAATGITQTGTYVGAVMGPLLFGAIAEHSSYSWAWLAGSSWFLAGSVFMLCGRRMLVSVKEGRGLSAHETLGPRPA